MARLPPGLRWLAGSWRLAGALFVPLAAAAPAAAQLHVSSGTATESKNAPIVFRADQVEYDANLGITVARGNVEIAQSGQVLLADTVTYNQRTDTITASGHVSLTQPTGEILFAQFMELRDQMKNTFAHNVRMLLSDRSRLAANAARRTNSNFTQLAHGVYSPCDLCPNDPTAPPAWQLVAREIDHDKAEKIVEFRDATMQIDGIPVFYTPYLSVPDPTVKRKSGFLTPSGGSSSTLGAHVTIPYFLVLGPDKDLTLAPRFTTSAGQVMAAEYRQRFGFGELDAVGSLNYSNFGTGTTENVGSEWRGHINAHGTFDLTPDYRTGFDLERASDQTYMLRFGFGHPVSTALISRAWLEGFGPRTATDLDAYIFQPLLPGLGDSAQPIVLPVANRSWQTDPDRLGGRWNFNANLLNIVREVGTQTRRLSLGSVWERPFRDGVGGEYKFTASLRGDAYSVADLSAKSTADLPASYLPGSGVAVDRNPLIGRVFPQVGLQWDYPLIRRGDSITALVEPIVAAYVGPTGGNRRNIPDEDSLSFDYNAGDLFRPDRLAGYDILDTGQRVDYGVRAGLYDHDGGTYRLLIGQSYRAEPNPFLPPVSGAADRLSDVVGRVVLSPSSFLGVTYRFRLDKATLANRTQEVGVAVGPPNFRVGTDYLLIPAQLPSEVTTTGVVTGPNIIYGKREQLSFSVSTRLTRYWSLNGSETINLSNSNNLVNGVLQPQASSTSLYSTVSAVYQDECMAFIGSLTQSGVRNGDVTPGVSVLFSVVFKNLGEVGGTLATINGTGQP